MQISNPKIIESELSCKLNGLFFEIQNKIRRYFAEKQYGDGLEELLKENKMGYEREKEIPIPSSEKKI